MPARVINENLEKDRVTVLTDVGVEITFGHVRGIVQSVARSPSRYVQKPSYDEARRLAKMAFGENIAPK